MTLRTSIVITGDTDGAQSALNELDADVRRTTKSTETLDRAQASVTKTGGQLRSGMQQLGYQVSDVAQGFALGVSPMTIFAQQGGQVIQSLSLMGGEAKGLLGILGGPWGIGISAAVSVAVALGGALFKDADGAAAASDAMKEFQQRQSDIGNFIDTTTGKLVEQNKTLVQNAILLRQSKIADLQKDFQKTGLDAVNAVRAASRTGYRFVAERQARAPTYDTALVSALQAAQTPRGLNIQELDRQLAKLGAGYADLRKKVSDAAGEMVLSQRKVLSLDAEIRALNGDTSALRSATGGSTTATRANTGAVSENAKAVRNSSGAAQQLAGDLAALEKKYDPVAAAARDYRTELDKIAKLEGAGKLSADKALDYQLGALERYNATLDGIQQKWLSERVPAFAKALGQDLEVPFVNVSKVITDGMTDAGHQGAAAFRTEGIAAAQAIAQIFGGAVGGTLGPLLGAMVGLQNGNFNSVGGPLGGILTLLAGGVGAKGHNDPIAEALGPHGFAEGLASVFSPVEGALKDLTFKLDGIFGERGSFTAALGQAAGYGALGAGIGSLTGGSQAGSGLGGVLGGFLGKKLLSGVLGSVAGPIGSIAGGLLGGLIGGLFHKTKQGGAVVTSATGESSTFGNSSGQIKAAGDAAGQVQQGLQQIAQQLGGALGDFNVAIGTYNGKWRVNPAGITKLGGGGGKLGNVLFGKNGEADAVAYAIMDAVKDGAVTGLSAAVQKALKSSPDIDTALQEALKVQQVEVLAGGIGAAFEQQFKALDQQAKERLRIARQYGFDVVAIEKKNAEDRLKLQQQLLDSQVGSLQKLVDEMTSGSLFEGSAVDQRTALLAQIAKAKTDLDNGVDGAGDTLAQLFEQLNSVSKDVYGTTGGFAADRSQILDQARSAIAKANAQIAAAEKASDPALATTNAALDENNSQNAQIIAALKDNSQYLAAMMAGANTGQSTARLQQLARTSRP